MLVLTAPAYLLLLLPLAIAAAGLAAATARRPSPLARLGIILRCAALAVLVLAIAQPEWRHSAVRHDLVIVLDTSASISPADRAIEAAWLRRALSTASADAPVGVVGFAGTAVATTLYGPPSARTFAALMRPVGGGAQTDIASALRLAAGIAAPGARLVLLSDGVPTLGDTAAAVTELAAQQIGVDIVPLHDRHPDVALTRMSLPPSVPAGADLSLQLTLTSTRAVTGTLTVLIDGRRLGTESVALRAGDTPYVVDVPGQVAGWHSVRASIVAPDDALPQNDVLSAVTDVAPVPRLLLVAAQPGSVAAATLAGSVATIVPATPARMPATSAALAGYAGIVLDDLPASALTGAQIAALDLAVRQRGVGLLVLGGTHSLTQGRYNQSALERLLPVLSDTPASLQDGNVALQLVLDRSGSMDNLAGDVPKIVMSRAAAHLAADFAIAHTDDLGILDFDQASHILVPIGKVTTGDAPRIARAIDGMVSDGGTNIYQGLQDGIQQISRSAAPYHHIILMTDGRSDPADYRPLLREAQQRKITISTVGLGPDADVQLLQSIATARQGEVLLHHQRARSAAHLRRGDQACRRIGLGDRDYRRAHPRGQRHDTEPRHRVAPAAGRLHRHGAQTGWYRRSADQRARPQAGSAAGALVLRPWAGARLDARAGERLVGILAAHRASFLGGCAPLDPTRYLAKSFRPLGLRAALSRMRCGSTRCGTVAGPSNYGDWLSRSRLRRGKFRGL